MIVEVIFALSFIPFLWIAPKLNKGMQGIAVRKKLKEPEEYNRIGDTLFIIPAQAICRLLTDYTSDGFFLHELSTRDSWGKWALSMLLFIIIFFVLALFAVYIQKRFILKTSKTISTQ